MKCAKVFLFLQGESPHDRGMSASLALHKARPGFPRQASDIAWSLCECLCLWVCVFVFVCMSLSLCQCLCLFAINFWRSWTDNWQTISSSSCFVFVGFEGTRVCVSDCVFGRLAVCKYMSLYVLTDKLQTQLNSKDYHCSTTEPYLYHNVGYQSN